MLCANCANEAYAANGTQFSFCEGCMIRGCERLNAAIELSGKPLWEMLDDLERNAEELVICRLVANVRTTDELTRKIDTLERIRAVIRDGITTLFESLRDDVAADRPEIHGATPDYGDPVG